MLKPSLITFTGADDMTDIGGMQAISAAHPVEFAILFSRSREGQTRYPTAAWIDRVRSSSLKLAAHICGAWATQIVEAGESEIDHRLAGFDRVQINTELSVDIDRILAWRDRVERLSGQRVEPILQCRSSFPEDPRVSWLFDPSGGNGLEPKAWPRHPKSAAVRFGYAGGIGPENVTDVLSKITHADGAWIDMESRVRNAEDEFDLGLCLAVCERVQGAKAPA